MRRLLSRADFFGWCSHSRTGILDTDFRDVASRYVDATNWNDDWPLSAQEHAFWSQIAHDLGDTSAWTGGLYDAREKALRRIAAIYFGLDDTDPRWYHPNDLADLFMGKASMLHYGADSNCLFLCHFDWSTFDEISRSVGDALGDIRVGPAFTADFTRKMGVDLAAGRTYSYGGLNLSGGDFSIEAYVRTPTLISGTKQILKQGSGGAGTYELYVDAGTNLAEFKVVTAGPTITAQSDALSGLTEYDLKVTGDWAANEIKLYVNGVLKDTQAWNDAIPAEASDLYVGSAAGSNDWNTAMFGLRISDVVR